MFLPHIIQEITKYSFEQLEQSYILRDFWNHAGLYIGDDGEKPEQVIHAVSEGVIQEDILNFMRTDHMLVMRIVDENGQAAKAIERAKSIVGAPYDFGFDFKNTNRFSCTELVAYCYPDIVVGKKRLGKLTIIADDFFNCDELETVWNSRIERVDQMSVQSF